ncbi:MAG: hypothetical protein ACYCW6_16155 [Candidatus Xenobia bacterium]
MMGSTALTSVLRRHFQQWSQGKPAIAPEDVYRELANPANKGNAAAAVAFLAYWEDGCHYSESFTPDNIGQYEEAAGSREVGDNDYDKYFRTAQQNLKAQKQFGLYPPGGLQMTDLRQGWMPDCHLVATVGALLYKNPHALDKVIRPHFQARYTVSFPGASGPQNVQLTDAEIAYVGSARPRGLAQLVLEEAAGQIAASRNPAQKFGNPFYAEAMLPGYPNESITLLTGHAALVSSTTPAKNVDPKVWLDHLREALKAPPGIVIATSNQAMYGEQHAVAVLHYDPKTDMVTCWNPWGEQAAQPDVVPLQNGIFQMKLSAFPQHFLQLTFEDPSRNATV